MNQEAFERLPRASILIVSWKVRETLSECLRTIESELEQSGLPIEVIVVDNDSRDGTVEHLHCAFPWVRVLENDENLGFAAANNQAARATTASIWILLNPDTEVEPGALKALLTRMEEEPEAAIVAPRLVNSDGSLQHSCFLRPTVLRELARLFHFERLVPGVVYRMETWPKTTHRPVDVVAGACMVVRSAALGEEELFDEQFFMYSEEIDLCERVRRAGWRILWIPETAVVHHVGISTSQAEEEMFLELYRSKLIFFRKHDGRLATMLYKGVLLLAASVRLLLTPLAALGKEPQRGRRLRLARYYLRLAAKLPSV